MSAIVAGDLHNGSKAYLESTQTSKMELFAKISN